MIWVKAYNGCYAPVNAQVMITAQIARSKLHLEKGVWYFVQGYGPLMLA